MNIKTMVYIASIEPLQDRLLFQIALQQASAQRREKVLAYHNDLVKRQALGVELLLRKGLEAFGFSGQELVYEYGENGKPSLAQAKEIHFNFSHSGDVVMCAVSTEEVGCDIEKIVEKDLKIAERFFCKEEAQAIQSASSEEEKVEIDRTGHNAFLMLADGSWTYNNMNDDANDRSLPTGGLTAAVTEDGTYTVDINIEDVVDWMNSAPDVTDDKKMVVGDPAFGLTVLNVDIAGLADQMGVSTKDNDAWTKWCEDNGIKESGATAKDKTEFAKSSGLSITDLTLSADGEEIYKYADDEITFADIEANGKIRIEIYNAYGDTKETAPQAIKDFAGEGEFETLSATFTVSGIKAAE